MADTEIIYSLAKSVIRITGQATEVEDPLVGTTIRSADVVTELLTVPDLTDGAQRTLRIPSRMLADTSSVVTLRDDRRIESVEAKFTGRGKTAVKAGIVVGGVIAGGVLAFVAPPLAPLVLGGALGAAGSLNLMQDQLQAQPDPNPAQQRFLAYSLDPDNADDAEKLWRYREAINDLTTAHAAAAGGDDLAVLEGLSKQLAFVRAEAAIYEAKFAAWCLDQVKTTRDPIEPVDFDINDLPNQAELMAALNTEDLDGPAKQLQVESPAWKVIARRFGVAVSIDPVLPQRSSQQQSGDGEIKIGYRPGTDVTIRVWKVTAVTGAEEEPVSDVPLPPEAYFVTDLLETRTARVVLKTTNPVTFALNVKAVRSGSLKVSFNDIGEPKEIGGDSSSQVFDTIAELGDNVKSSLEAGVGIAAAVAPGSATAAALERRVAIQKHLKDLAPAPAPDDLKQAVEQAELEARLRLARIESLRTSGTVIYSIGS